MNRRPGAPAEFKEQGNAEINDQHLKSNGFLLGKIRTYGAINAGIVAGILGLSGLNGFLFYFIMFFVVSAFLHVKAGGAAGKYFPDASEIYVGGMFKDLLIYIMLWMISHNVVNVL